MSSRKKSKIYGQAVIKELIMTLSEKELQMMFLLSPKSLFDLCIMYTLEEQLIAEGKIQDCP